MALVERQTGVVEKFFAAQRIVFYGSFVPAKPPSDAIQG